MLPSGSSIPVDERRSALTAALSVVAAGFPVGLGVFLVAFQNGSFDPRHRYELAVVVWWALAVALALGIVHPARLSRVARAGAGALGLFAVWTLASAVWAADAGTAVAESARTFGYVAVFLLAALASSGRALRAWVSGLALGATAVLLVALVSRLFPGAFSDRGITSALPAVGGRLSFPLGYWNALAGLVAVTIPVLVGCSLSTRRLGVRAVALGIIPALAATLYLTSSRGGVLAAVVGTAAAILLAGDRWAALGRIMVAGVGSLSAVAVVASRATLANRPHAAAAAGEGRSVFLWVLLLCAATGVAFALAARALGPSRPPAVAGVAIIVVIAAALVVATVAVHPLARLDAFRQPPTLAPSAGGDFAQRHLFSGAGNGRWQFWSAAGSEWRAHPWLGGGAGSFGPWWLQHGSFRYQVEDAHSLYVETLAELGVVGFLLFVAFCATVVAAIAVGVRRAAAGCRGLVAGFGGAVVAYGVAAALDWSWEVPGVTVPALVAAGLLAGPMLGGSDAQARLGRPGRRVGAALGVLVASGAAVLLVGDLALGASRDAAAAGSLPKAAAAAKAARTLEPWSAEPELQLALVLEQAGDLSGSVGAVDRAVDRSPNDWAIRFVAARIDTEAGRIASARSELSAARLLNPRAPFLEP